jgi:hypothetical protein
MTSHVPDLDAEEEVDLGRYGRALLVRWWLPLAGLVAGILIGYVASLGGSKTFRAQSIVYLGQPLGVLGANAVQALNTNPSAARSIITAESVLRPVAARVGMKASRLRAGTSVTGVQGYLPKLGQTPLVQVTVKAPEPAKARLAANALAHVLVARMEGLARAKITNFSAQLAADNDAIKAVNAAINAASVSTTDKLLLQIRLSTLQSDKTQTSQLLLLAQQVELPRVVTAAAAERTSARNHRNSAAVGGLIGLILGILAAVLWEPVTRARTRA